MTAWRVMTWNILGSKQGDLAAVAAVIRDVDPDVASLQEVRKGQLRRLARTLGWQYTWARKHYPYTPLIWWHAEGVGLLSPWAVSAPMRTTISPGISTWLYKHRVLLAATITRRDATLRVFDTHLASDDADERIAQARRVADRVRADTTPSKVVTGDLNTTHGTEVEVLRELLAVGLHDPGGTVTNPAVAPTQRIDYVLLPAGAQVMETRTPDGGETWARLSDHLPVMVHFELGR